MAASATITGGASFRPETPPDTENVDVLAISRNEQFQAETDTVAQIRIDADDDISGDAQEIHIELMAAGANFTTDFASDNDLDSTGHGLVEGDEVRLSSSGTLPAGLTAGTPYYVLFGDANKFRVSLTVGGTEITLTSDGTGTHSWQLYAAPVLTYQYPNTGPAVPVKILSNRDGGHGDFTKVKGFMVMLVPTNDGELVKGTFTSTVASPGVLTTSADHGKSIGQRIRFEGDDLPAPLAEDTDYYVLTVPADNTMTIAATPGGTAINVSDAGSGTQSWKTMGDADGKAYVKIGDPTDPDNHINVPMELYYRPDADPPVRTKPFWTGALPQGVTYDTDFHLEVHIRDDIGNQNLSVLINLLGN